MTTAIDHPAAVHARHADDHAGMIRSAARVIRGHASAAAHRPWRIDHRDADGISIGVTGDEYGHLADVVPWDAGTAPHISLWHPGLAAAIADLLDVAADTDDLPTRWQALAVARALPTTQEPT